MKSALYITFDLIVAAAVKVVTAIEVVLVPAVAIAVVRLAVVVEVAAVLSSRVCVCVTCV